MTNYSCAMQKNNQTTSSNRASEQLDEIRQGEPTMDRSKFADLIGTILEEESRFSIEEKSNNDSINAAEAGETTERINESFVVTRELFNNRFIGFTRLLRTLVFISKM